MAVTLPFNWTAAFVIDNQRAEIVVKSDTLNPSPYVSFTGTFEGGGQIVNRLRETAVKVGSESVDVSDVLDLCNAWDALHFKRFADLTESQLTMLESVQTSLVLLDGERIGGAVSFEEIEEAEFDENSNTIDSRDVIERIEVLRSALLAVGLEDPDPEALDLDSFPEDDREAIGDAAEELAALLALEKEASPYADDWEHGETMIRDSYFEEYAEELASDIGAINKEANWPLNHIDWKAAAEALKQDYTEVRFKGVSYQIR